MDNLIEHKKHLVFGLDIGTRSIVGTVGYKDNDHFTVIAQHVKEHETRAMIDGQIHNIARVSQTIIELKNILEKQINRKLSEVCIAAAGRVLKTVTVQVIHEFPTDTVISDEHIYSLDLMGVEKAYETIREQHQIDNENFYSVGYSAIRYYLNDYTISNLEGHKAKKISADILATFLPEEVINGLYSVIEQSNLQVVNLTLEPIAAIGLAIPEHYRLLNIALVDIGAGTSDISITKDGSIIAYGMIPYAGDEITECIVQKYLVDFNTAEMLKISTNKKKEIIYRDIMGITQKILPSEIIETIENVTKTIAKSIADKIVELNGDKTVSAVFVIGGGGKIPIFTNYLAEYLNLPEERVALRGEEVLKDITFCQEDVKKDSLLVTPIGICLNFYDQKNNFIFVNVNGERIKLYDNLKLTILDAAMQVGFTNELIFPQRGTPLNFILNQKQKIIRGQLGEAAIIRLNEEEVGINTPIRKNDKIELIPSTKGEDAVITINQLSEYDNSIVFIVNNQKISCPKLVEINGVINSIIETGYYNICEGDTINILNYYTLGRLFEYMDITPIGEVFINHIEASYKDLIYDNFVIVLQDKDNKAETKSTQKDGMDTLTKVGEHFIEEIEDNKEVPHSISVLVNKAPVTLSGKTNYIFVDIFDYFYFDLTKPNGSQVISKINGKSANYFENINNGDILEIYWIE